ncbi:MAG: hypothetical protein EON60_06675 [Alphaproteobacteria bacterium]|nr:MAG: hypothetical protein EON60_06675 [Alphaproteobacteria bacterium]
MGIVFIDGPGGGTLSGKVADDFCKASDDGYATQDAVRIAHGKEPKGTKSEPTGFGVNATRR